MTEEENQQQMEERQMSEEIHALAEAMAKAQSEVGNAHKSEDNKFFNSKYADLKSCWDACRECMTKNGLAVMQLPFAHDNGVGLETIITHKSGQWIKSRMVMPVDKNNAHGFGSALTYARRYALASMVGIAPEDDDGNAASTAPPKESYKEKMMRLKIEALPKSIEKHLDTITVVREGIAEKNYSKASEAWNELSNDEKETIWIAPKWLEGTDIEPPFTTKEREIISSSEFRKAHFGDKAA